MSNATGNGLVYKFPRDQLAGLVGQKVTARGVYDRSGTFTPPRGRVNHTAMVERLFVTAADGTTFDVNHCWVQFADAIKAQAPRGGERVEFTATVGTYTRDRPTDDGQGKRTVKDYNLSYPEDVRFPDRAPGAEGEAPTAAPEPEEAPAPEHGPSALDVVLTAKWLAGAVGGWDELRQLIDALES
jgi:hypothetical protein